MRLSLISTLLYLFASTGANAEESKSTFSVGASVQPFAKKTETEDFTNDGVIKNMISFQAYLGKKNESEFKVFSTSTEAGSDYAEGIFRLSLFEATDALQIWGRIGASRPAENQEEIGEVTYSIWKTILGGELVFVGNTSLAVIGLELHTPQEKRDLEVDGQEFNYRPNSFRRIWISHAKDFGPVSIRSEAGHYSFGPATFETPMFDQQVSHDDILYLKVSGGLNFGKGYIRGGYQILDKEPEYAKLFILTGTQTQPNTHAGTYLELGVAL
jgi:hypothetical protein